MKTHKTPPLRGILKMVKDLRIQVVAEGVETEAEFAFLAQHGCDYMQGYLVLQAKTAGRTARMGRTPAVIRKRTLTLFNVC